MNLNLNDDMKRIFSAVMLLMVSMVMSATVYQGKAGTSANYELDTETGVMRISGKGLVALQNYIGVDNLDAMRTYIKSIVAENGITSCNSWGFAQLPELTKVTLPEGFAFSNYAFQNCPKLVTVEGCAINYAEGLFYGCKSLKHITCPTSVTYPGRLKRLCFYGCASLESVELPENMVEIGEYAFDGCSSLRDVKMPETLTTLGKYAFRGCSSLKEMVLDEHITAWASGVFSNCSSLEKVELLHRPSNHRIPDSCFVNCTSLKSIDIPSTISTVGKSAFNGCTSLESLSIASSVELLQDYAFYGCNHLAKICLHGNAPNITDLTFKYYPNLEGVIIYAQGVRLYPFDSIFPHWMTVEAPADVKGSAGVGLTYEFSWPKMRIYGEGSVAESFSTQSDVGPIRTFVEELTLEEGVKGMGTWAFASFSSLEKVSLSDSITSIGQMAFRQCEQLRSVTIPSQVRSVGNNAFLGCINLSNIRFLSPSTTLSNSAFPQPSSTGVLTVPEGAKSHYAVLKESLGDGWIFGGASPIYDEEPEKDAEGYYLISRVPDLLWVRDNFGSIYSGYKIRQTADLDLSPYCHAAKSLIPEVNWKPLFIKTASNYGTYDGQGHTITGLYCNATDHNKLPYASFFGYAGWNGAQPGQGLDTYIKNLTIEGKVMADISSAIFAGAGCMVSFENCTSKGSLTVKATGAKAINGGIAGDIRAATASFDNCRNEATITVTTTPDGNYVVGGVAAAGHFSHCVNTGNVTVTGKAYVGGVAGQTSPALFGQEMEHCLEYCSNTGIVKCVSNTENGFSTGGALLGRLSADVSLYSCWSDANVINDMTAIPAQAKVTYGSLLGSVKDVTPRFVKCYYNGDKQVNTASAYGENKSTAQFTSGEVASLLGDCWGQQLDLSGGRIEKLPVLYGYPVYNDEGYYTNYAPGISGASRLVDHAKHGGKISVEAIKRMASKLVGK